MREERDLERKGWRVMVRDERDWERVMVREERVGVRGEARGRVSKTGAVISNWRVMVAGWRSIVFREVQFVFAHIPPHPPPTPRTRVSKGSSLQTVLLWEKAEHNFACYS